MIITAPNLQIKDFRQEYSKNSNAKNYQLNLKETPLVNTVDPITFAFSFSIANPTSEIVHRLFLENFKIWQVDSRHMVEDVPLKVSFLNHLITDINHISHTVCLKFRNIHFKELSADKYYTISFGNMVLVPLIVAVAKESLEFLGEATKKDLINFCAIYPLNPWIGVAIDKIYKNCVMDRELVENYFRDREVETLTSPFEFISKVALECFQSDPLFYKKTPFKAMKVLLCSDQHTESEISQANEKIFAWYELFYIKYLASNS